MPRPPRPRDPVTNVALLKMSELAAQSGLPAPTIQHYLREGLLPAPTVRTGRSMAWYHPSSVERLKLVRRLQHEHRLPLAVIRQLVHAGSDARVQAAALAVAGLGGLPGASTGRTLRHWLDGGIHLEDRSRSAER